MPSRGPCRVQEAKSLQVAKLLQVAKSPSFDAPAVSSAFLRAFGGADLQGQGQLLARAHDMQGPSGARAHLQGPSLAQAHPVSVHFCGFCRRGFKSQHAGPLSVRKHTRCKCIQRHTLQVQPHTAQGQTLTQQGHPTPILKRRHSSVVRELSCACACCALAYCVSRWHTVSHLQKIQTPKPLVLLLCSGCA